MKNLKTFEEFKQNINESELINEEDNLHIDVENDKFAIIQTGVKTGYGAGALYTQYRGGYGVVIETGNDKVILRKKADELKKSINYTTRMVLNINYVVIPIKTDTVFVN